MVRGVQPSYTKHVTIVPTFQEKAVEMDMKFASDSDDIHIEGIKVSDDFSIFLTERMFL